MTADDATAILTQRFVAAAQRGEIRASRILFRGTDHGQPPALPTESEEGADCRVAFPDLRKGHALHGVSGDARGADGNWKCEAPRFGPTRPLIFPPS